jgi:hypothetical protein
MGKNGSIHVHVQSHDLDMDQVFSVVKFYSKYQSVIDKMVPESRVNCRWAQPYARGITADRVSSMFSLNIPVATRNLAKFTRQYSVVNCAMHRCAVPAHRTLEFRQQGVSRKACNTLGWVAFVSAIVDCAARFPAIIATANAARTGLPSLLRFIAKYEEASGAKDIGAWVKWRISYLDQKATPAMVEEAAAYLTEFHGAFHLVRNMKVNNALAIKIMELGRSTGRFESSNNRVRAIASPVQALVRVAD